MPKKKLTMEMVTNESDLARGGFDDFVLVKEIGFRPDNRMSSPNGVTGVAGITGQRGFLRQIPSSDVVARVIPCSDASLAKSSVEKARESILHDPSKRVIVAHSKDICDLRIEGLERMFAHEETLESGIVTYKVLWIFSYVERVQFSIQASSRADVLKSTYRNWPSFKQTRFDGQ